ncbi:IPT/TIG domain-containing protein [Chloroflexota bacterium]
MKYTKVLRMFSTVFILSLLVMAMPAMAADRLVVLVPEEGAIGSEVTVAGEGFNKSTEDSDKYAVIYFSSEEATLVDDIDIEDYDGDVSTYEVVKDGIWLDEDGDFEITFDVPDELNDGDDDEDVTSGTYYVYVCHYLSTSPPTIAPRIRAIAEFIVIGGDVELDPDEGPVGTEVEIAGTEFTSRDEIVIEYDGDEVDIESGDDETDSGGDFISTIIIPESTAGEHTVTVTVAGSEVEVEFTVEPYLVLDPTSGEANTDINVSGTGFGRRTDVVVYFDGVGLANTTTTSDGSFETTLTVPDLDSDVYDVEAEDEDENIDTARFTITVPPPSTSPTPAPEEPTSPPAPVPSTTTASISETSGSIGKDVIVGGAGFEADGKITVKYDGNEVTTATADASGIFVAAFKIPVSKYGEHIITASDGTSTETFTFTVESVAPPIPAPLLPEMGVKVKAPISFDWENVVDDSLPLTYTLQIADDDGFSASSIVIEKKGLAKSEYTVEETEAVKLIGQEATYYWRVRAVDGAENAGDWTGAGEFNVSGGGMGLPNWALYTLLGVGALVLFAVGYWLGRRTAYYY